MLSIQVLWFCTKQEQEYLKLVVIIDQLDLITINRNCVLNLRKLVLKTSNWRIYFKRQKYYLFVALIFLDLEGNLHWCWSTVSDPALLTLSTLVLVSLKITALHYLPLLTSQFFSASVVFGLKCDLTHFWKSWKSLFKTFEN